MRRILILPLAVACSDYELSSSVKEEEGADTALPEQEDVFYVEGTSGVDIIFFGDTSTSMQPELVTLGSLIEGFVSHLSDFASDWHLLAVTGPDGCGVGGIFTPETEDFATLFAQAILTPPGEDLVDEWGLNNTTEAVKASAVGGCNEGFLREHAPLQIIIISDEPDSSPGWDTDPTGYWKTYVDTVIAEKGDADLVVYSAVAGPVPDGCEGALPGTGYAEAVSYTGGEFLSICDAWYDQLDILAEIPARQDTFVLSADPVVGSIRVWINDVERSRGWTWDETQNAVVFSQGIPETGDIVRIRYNVE